MAWQKDVPHATDQINISQGDVQANFQALDPLFNGVTNFATIFTTIAATPTTSASQLSVFAANDSSSVPQLFIGPPSTGTPTNITGSGQATNGWARLPSKILIKWGTTTAAVNTLGTITFPVSASVPVFSSIFYVSAAQTFAAGPTTSTLNTSVSAGNFTTTTFQVWPNATTAPLSGTISITYLAIGI